MNGKKVLIVGIDGYIGWSLAMHLATRGHKVAGIDNYSRRRNVAKVGYLPPRFGKWKRGSMFSI